MSNNFLLMTNDLESLLEQLLWVYSPNFGLESLWRCSKSYKHILPCALTKRLFGGFSVKLAISWICNLTIQAHPFPLWLFFYHHLLLPRDGNTMYFSISEAKTPVKNLQIIYILVWNKKAYPLSRTMKNSSRGNLLPQSSWK